MSRNISTCIIDDHDCYLELFAHPRTKLIFLKIRLISLFCISYQLPTHTHTAAIASRCFYHLQSYSDSLKLALSAGKYVDITQKSEYIDTLLANCIDEYVLSRAVLHTWDIHGYPLPLRGKICLKLGCVMLIVRCSPLSRTPSHAPNWSYITPTITHHRYKALRLRQIEGDADVVIDPRMEAIIEQMFKRCYNDGCYDQAVGVALGTCLYCLYCFFFLVLGFNGYLSMWWLSYPPLRGAF